MSLQACRLTAERNERCLFSELSFTLHSGEVLQIVGANGTGKTTLLRMMAGLLPPVEGEVVWCGEPLIYIGHRMGITGGLTPRENLRFAARLAGCTFTAQQIDRALAAVGLQGVEHLETYSLSMGQQRRVGLARLILIPARLWILDEPLAALDTGGIAIVEQLIAQHVVKQGMVLMTSHQPLHLTNCSLQLLALAS